MFFDFEQNKYLYLIQKENMDPSISEVLSKNVFSFAANFFSSIQVDEGF